MEKTGMKQSKRSLPERTEKYGFKILGITGGVGAGKSTILTYLKEKHGARILEADAVGHLVQQPDTLCWEQIVKAFGAEILNPDRSIDRGKLGAIVYTDRTKLEQLNAIVHPAVKTYICRQIEECRSAGLTDDPKKNQTGSAEGLIVIEAALLLEDHYDEICDEIWYIYADERTREERLRRSRGYSHEKARQIMENQLSDEEFRRCCQVVIDNSDSSPDTAYFQVDRELCRLQRKF